MAEATETDIFQQQKKTIDTLIDVLQKQGSSTPQQIVYAQQPEQEKKPPNYVLYGALAIVAFLLFKK